MNANYAEICRVGNLEVAFQQVLLVQFFWNFHSILIVVKYHNLNWAKKSKKYFLRQNFQKISLL